MLDKQGYTRARARMHKPTRQGTHTHAHTDKYVILIAFPRQKSFVNAPHCYVIYTLPVFFRIFPEFGIPTYVN